MIERKREIFEETLTRAYDHDGYMLFLRELLNDVTMVAPNKEIPPYNTFSAAVKSYTHIGTFVGGDDNKVALFSVCLKRDKNVENARSMQRNFIKSLLEISDCAGALVSFYTDGDPDKWRLSLIRIDYEFSKGKISEKLTPARRYSYLVGSGEPCHTAQERLYPIFVKDDRNPSLDDLEEAFSVEAVTDDFFRKYREKYFDLKEYLDSNPSFITEAAERGFNSEQFAKKLMGQIVFLYFIQKKGWLGVEAFPERISSRDFKSAFYARGDKPKELMPQVYIQEPDNPGSYRLNRKALLSLSQDDEAQLSMLVKGDAWGEGPKDFMRQIFSQCKETGGNFFDDYLEPLFYTGLNQNRGVNAFFQPLHRRIPFLNGGLFEEMDGYDWRNNNFDIPNEMFSNVDAEDRDADGILDIFDRFNFTIAEDEPMEREVAIDPEMLGKVFENLLDAGERKSKGAFYTPREIVQFMCQESLISYLSGKTDISEDDVRKFVLYGEYFRDEDTRKTISVEDEKTHRHYMMFDKNKSMEMPESILSFKHNVNRLKEIDNLLANVKIADIAVGSGAFPLGMLTEIVKARDTLTSYMMIDMDSYHRLNFHAQRNSYRMKRETIKNCIFACDIEASATDITKLRLWLSLVIDNVISDEEDEILGYSTKPRELPNLDCNVICGNSLMDRFHDVRLITESSVLGNVSDLRQITIEDPGTAMMINELIDLQSKLFDEKDRVAKESYKDQIQDIYDKIVMEQLRTYPDVVDEYYRTISQPSRPFVLWQLYFPKVFRDNGGFDIVIGNPPYIQLQKTIDEETHEKLGDQYQDAGFSTFTKTGDIYCLFYEKGFELLNEGGILTFITSNKWMRAGYGEGLRKFLSSYNPKLLVDFAGQKIFETATVDVNVILATKNANEMNTHACVAKDDCIGNLSVYFRQNGYACSFNSSASWTILSSMEQNIKSKIEKYGTPLKEWDVKINRGILTGFNEAFIIDGEKRNKLISEDPRSAEIIRPILRGKDIKRYEYNFADLWLINSHNGIKDKNIPPIDINEYPAIKAHLDGYGTKLTSRYDQGNTPYNLRNCVYMDEFAKQKIVYREISVAMDACLVGPGILLNNKCYLVTGDHLIYLLTFFNSSLFTKIILPETNITGGKGEVFLNSVKAIVPNTDLEKHIIDEYNKFSDGKITQKEFDSTIDTLFCDIYKLSKEERIYVLSNDD